MDMSESARHENMLSAMSAAKSQMSDLVAQAERVGWNAAIVAAREAQPCTAENPNESSYERGKFDGVMAYARVLRELHKR